MIGRGRGAIAMGILAVLVAGGVGLQRMGPRAEPVAPSGSAPSGWWVCPHGGGPGWRTTLYLANPGATAATVRVTNVGRAPAEPSVSMTVSAGTASQLDVPSSDRAAATLVEWFGSRVVAGWVSRAGGDDSGVAAEPCGATGRTWFAPDGSTLRGEHTFLIVTNPSASEAVFSVVLYTNDLPPIRQSNWTNLQLTAFGSTALNVGRRAPNEAAVSAEVDASSGRVAVSSLDVSDTGGVRSATATAVLSDRAILPVSAGAGQSEVVVAVPGSSAVPFGATLLSGRAPQPVGGLEQVSQSSRSAKSYPVITNGASSVDVLTAATGSIAVAIRSHGALDTAATGGALGPASSWVVLPTVVGRVSHPGLVLVNPGADPAQVTLHLLAAPGDQLPADLTITVAPDTTVSVPEDFLATYPQAAVVVRATGSAIVALGASTSLGRRGTNGYALALGVPIPPSG
jgi:hypothetical protein